MAANSNISWTDASWTPIRARNKTTGKIGWHCEKVSAGCDNCYSAEMNEGRFGTGLPFKPGHRKDIDIFLDEKMLLAPLKWKSPRKIFVCSMTDLFGEFVSEYFIARILATSIVAHLYRGHVLQFLTKRSARMRQLLNDKDFWLSVNEAAESVSGYYGLVLPLVKKPTEYPFSPTLRYYSPDYPPPGLWLGVSCEDQTRADERIPDLLATPAAVRFVSAEPLIGPIDFTMIPCGGQIGGHILCEDALRGPPDMQEGERLDWIIAGAESGTDRRPMQIEWAESIRQQCADAGTAFFFKQDGHHKPGQRGRASDALWACKQFPEVTT